MFNHEPKNYICPFCSVINNIEHERVYSRKQDIFFQDDFGTALIATHQLPKNPGQALVVTNQHIENFYDLSDELCTKTGLLVKKVAMAIRKTYEGCVWVFLPDKILSLMAGKMFFTIMFISYHVTKMIICMDTLSNVN